MYLPAFRLEHWVLINFSLGELLDSCENEQKTPCEEVCQGKCSKWRCGWNPPVSFVECTFKYHTQGKQDVCGFQPSACLGLVVGFPFKPPKVKLLAGDLRPRRDHGAVSIGGD